VRPSGRLADHNLDFALWIDLEADDMQASRRCSLERPGHIPLLQAYQASEDFTGLAASTRRSYVGREHARQTAADPEAPQPEARQAVRQGH
jgi:hypothetical protein